MRWRQKYDPETGRSTFVPIDDSAVAADKAAGIIVRDFDAFKSPVDGSIIRNHRELQEHNRRNNVVSASEFSPEYLEKKSAERERKLRGERTKEETLQVRREIYERIIRSEQGLPLQ